MFKLVESGYTIENACKKINITRTFLYKRMNTEQKYNLKSLKILNAEYSCKLNSCISRMSHKALVEYVKHMND